MALESETPTRQSAAGSGGVDYLVYAWRQLRTEEPRLRIRSAAQRLGVSELDLLLTESDNTVRRLEPEFHRMYTSLFQLGPVMTLARNDQVVHETTGTVGQFTLGSQGNVGLCLGEIDLRVFFRHWEHAVAVRDPVAPPVRRYSLQFFDSGGTAVHKVFAGSDTDMAAWHRLVTRFTAEEQRPALDLVAAAAPARQAADADVESLARDWAAITDVHQFNAVLSRHGLDRLSALELMDGRWTRPLPQGSLERLLQDVAASGIPIMVFTGNRGIVQIFTGAISRLRRTGEWFNVLDKSFHLHVRTTEIASLWRVVRPSEDGHVTSVDCFNARGELVLSLFGERKPGHPELPMWRDHVAILEEPQ